MSTASKLMFGSAQPSGSSLRSRTKKESSRLLRASCAHRAQISLPLLHSFLPSFLPSPSLLFMRNCCQVVGERSARRGHMPTARIAGAHSIPHCRVREVQLWLHYALAQCFVSEVMSHWWSWELSEH
jgi:hypothetical protein